MTVAVLFLGYFGGGPFGPSKFDIYFPPKSGEITAFFGYTMVNLQVGYLLVTGALLYSIWTRRWNWYESKVLLFYELIVFIEFIVLLPLFTKIAWGI
jgi:hypothetical protein